MIEIMNFTKRLLEIFPVVKVMNDVSNVAVESSNHTFTDDDLSKCDFISCVRVGAENDEWKELINKLWDEIYNFVIQLLLLLKCIFFIIEGVDVDKELLFPTIELEHLSVMETFRTFVVALVSLDIEDSPCSSVKLRFVLIYLPKEGIQKDSSKGKPPKICVKQVNSQKDLEWAFEDCG